MKRLFLAMLVAVGLIAIGNAVNKNSSKGSASSSSNSPLSNIKNIVNKDSQESVQDLIKEQQKVVMRLYWDQDEQKERYSEITAAMLPFAVHLKSLFETYEEDLEQSDDDFASLFITISDKIFDDNNNIVSRSRVYEKSVRLFVDILKMLVSKKREVQIVDKIISMVDSSDEELIVDTLFLADYCNSKLTIASLQKALILLCGPQHFDHNVGPFSKNVTEQIKNDLLLDRLPANFKITPLELKGPDEDKLISWSPNREFLIIGLRNELRLFDSKGTKIWTKKNLSTFLNGWNPNSTFLTVGPSSNLYKVSLLNMHGNTVWSKTFDDYVHEAKWSPDGKNLAISLRSNGLYVFNTQGKNIWINKDYSWLNYWHPNNKFLAAMFADGVSLLDDHGKEVWKTTFNDGVRSASWSSNGKLLAVQSTFNKLYLLNAHGKVILTKDFGDRIKSISWSPDDNFLAVGLNNGIILLDSNGKTLWTNQKAQFRYTRLFDETKQITWSPDGKLLAARYHNRVSLFNTKGKKIWTEIFDDKTKQITWNPNDRILTVVFHNKALLFDFTLDLASNGIILIWLLKNLQSPQELNEAYLPLLTNLSLAGQQLSLELIEERKKALKANETFIKTLKLNVILDEALEMFDSDTED